MIKAAVGDRIDGWIHVAFPFLFWWPIDPNLVTILGAVVATGAGLAFALGHFLLGGVLLLAGGFCDLVDGALARHNGVSTLFGAFLDSTLDRLVDVSVFLGIVVYYSRQGDLVMAAVCGVVLVTSVLTSYSKARAELVIGELRGGLLERGERIGGLALGALTGFVVPVLWLLAVGGVVTVAQRIGIAYRRMQRLDAERKSAESR